MKLSHVFVALFLVMSQFVLTLPVLSAQGSAQQKQLIYFHGDGCPHCANVDEWMNDNNIQETYPIDDREIYNSPDNARYFNEVMSDRSIPISSRGVPALVVGDEVLIGDQPIISQFYEVADSYLQSSSAEEHVEESAVATTEDKNEDSLSLWIVMSASVVDAINPCAFAVLLILLTAVLLKRDKKVALLSGLSFSASIFISYVLMGLGLYGAINATGIANLVTTFVGVLALGLGLLNIKDYFWYGKYTLIEVPRSWRPNMIALINKTTSPAGAFFVGFLVSLFLLPCTSGPYIVVLGLLAQNPLDAGAIGYLLLYNFIFVLPMLLITVAAYRGLNVGKLEEARKENLKKLHLVAGIILLSLGIFVLFF